MIIPSLIAAIVPMLIYLILIWNFDSYEKESFRDILRNYLWGALGAIFLSFIGSWFISTILSAFIRNATFLNKIDAIVVAPVVEESMKGIFLLLTVSSRKFDNITDGIVYGGAIGLGFGMTENFLYFITYGSTLNQWILLVVIRTLFSAVMHCVATASFGAFLGYAKFKNIFFKIFFPIIGILIAMLIHAAWNLSVSFERTTIYGFIFMFFNILIFVGVFFFSLLNEKKIIYRELLEEAGTGLIPVNHLQYINTHKRNYRGWVNENIRIPYVRAAVTLAFRKMQLRNSFGFNKIYYQNEVQKYRDYIGLLLNKNEYHDKV